MWRFFYLFIAFMIYSLSGLIGCKSLPQTSDKNPQNTESNTSETYKGETKTIREWLDILPDRYLSFQCEASEREAVLGEQLMIDEAHHYAASGVGHEGPPMLGETCFSLKAYPLSKGGQLLVITNEKFDELCGEMECFFLSYQDKNWIEIAPEALFEMPIQSVKSYCKNAESASVIEQSDGISAVYLLRVSQATQQIHVALQLCDVSEEQDQGDQIDAVHDEIKGLTFVWDLEQDRFVAK